MTTTIGASFVVSTSMIVPIAVLPVRKVAQRRWAGGGMVWLLVMMMLLMVGVMWWWLLLEIHLRVGSGCSILVLLMLLLLLLLMVATLPVQLLGRLVRRQGVRIGGEGRLPEPVMF